MSKSQRQSRTLGENSEDFVVQSSYSGWRYIVRGTQLYQYDTQGRMQGVQDYPTAAEARQVAASYATY